MTLRGKVGGDPNRIASWHGKMQVIAASLGLENNGGAGVLRQRVPQLLGVGRPRGASVRPPVRLPERASLCYPEPAMYIDTRINSRAAARLST